MDRMMLLAGRTLGVLGLAICAFAVIARIAGNYWIRGVELGSLLQVGIAGIAAGCFMLLWALTQRRS